MRKAVEENLMDTTSQLNESEAHNNMNSAGDVASLYQHENQNRINKLQKHEQSKSIKRKRHCLFENLSTGYKFPQANMAKAENFIKPASRADHSPPWKAAKEKQAAELFNSSKDVYFVDALGVLDMSLKSRKQPLESTSTSLNNMCSSTQIKEYKSSIRDPESSKFKHHTNIGFNSAQANKAEVNKSTCSVYDCKVEHSTPLKVLKIEREVDTFDSSIGVKFEGILSTKNSEKSMNTNPKSTNSKHSGNNGSEYISSIKEPESAKIPQAKIAKAHMFLSATPASKADSVHHQNTAEAGGAADCFQSTVVCSQSSKENRKPGGNSFSYDVAHEVNGSKTAFTCNSSTPTTSKTSSFSKFSSSSKQVSTVTHSADISYGFSSKNSRSIMYSDVRTGPIPMQSDMCEKIVQNIIDSLKGIGGVKLDYLRPILECISPQELYIFEENHPHIMVESDVLWQQYVLRNYRTKARLENESWRAMYSRCREEEARKLSALNDTIETSQETEAATAIKSQLAVVNGMVEPPRNFLKIQKQHGTKAKLVATSRVAPSIAKVGDARLKVSSTRVSKTSLTSKKAPLMKKVLRLIHDRFK